MHLLENGYPHRLRIWKLSTGDILTYPDAIYLSRHTEGGTHRVKLRRSGQIRMLRDVCLFEIDGMCVYW